MQALFCVSRGYLSNEKPIAEMAAIFKGRLIWGEDLMEIPLGSSEPAKHQGLNPPRTIVGFFWIQARTAWHFDMMMMAPIWGTA